VLSVAFFSRQYQNHSWAYATPLFLFILSGAMIYAVFYRTLGFFEKVYFGFLFVAPLLLTAFLIFTKLFDLYLFG